MSRSGEYVNNLSGEAAYKSFRPAPLPPSPPVALEEPLVSNLLKATRELAVLEGMSKKIPDIDLFVSMYVRKEALLSSQIEGTQCTLDDVLDPGAEENANRDVSDVINYVKATEFALKRLNDLPLCSRLIRETHAVLMQGVRGQEKSPGEFRTSQNWIGGGGSVIKDARYIPPNVEDMTEAMSDLEKFINSDTQLDPIICAALIHYQFETIHPFLDGNGRVGRLLITLYLLERKVISTPALYVSYFLKKNRVEYYDRMTEVRRVGNFEQWVNFFAEALADAARDAAKTVEELSALREKNRAKLEGSGKSAAALLSLFSYIEKNPIIETGKTADALGISYNAAARAIKALSDMEILKQSEKRSRAKIYAYEKYLSILRRDT